MSAIIEFIKQNIVCDIFLILAILSWSLTVGARIASKKEGRYVSGLPAMGGILFIIGFLTSSVKWIALFGLLDPDLLYLMFRVIPGTIRAEKEIKDHIPPDELDGETVVEYSIYNKEYEEIRFPISDTGSYESHRINRYIITQGKDGYRLLKVELTDRIIESCRHASLELCKQDASPKAEWISK